MARGVHKTLGFAVGTTVTYDTYIAVDMLAGELDMNKSEFLRWLIQRELSTTHHVQTLMDERDGAAS